MPAPILIIAAKSGQLGNRLWLFANFIAFAIEHRLWVLNPAFEEYADLFESTANNFLCSYPEPPIKIKGNPFLRRKYYAWIDRLAGSKKLPTISITRAQPFNWSQSEISFQVQKQPISLFKGWLFRDGWFMQDLDLLHQHGQEIRSYFKPLNIYQTRIDALITKARRECDLLIGVHIRQGDYQQHQNGRYFYTTEHYIRLMEAIASQCNNSIKIGFLVCSNVPQERSLFRHLNCIWGNDQITEDLYSFAECDYIMGAPSTYTMWAAFYGKKPLYMIREIDRTPSFSDFADSHQWRGVFQAHEDWSQAYWEWTH